MCGRFTLAAEPDALRAEFEDLVLDPEYTPRFNIAPTQPVLALGLSRDGTPRTGWLRWGLVPHWADTPSIGSRMINARAETIATKPAFRDAFASRRCLILADGFYEWVGEGSAKRPFRIRLPDGRPFAFAGVWERWREPDGERLYTCAIVTTSAAPAIARIHDRMPVILDRVQREDWLRNDANADPRGLLATYQAPGLEAYEVSRLVNHAANEVPECILPVTADA